MKTIRSFKCVYAIDREAWSIVLELDAGEKKRLDMEAAKIPIFLQAFDDATEALYDETAGEVVLTFEYADLDDDEDDDFDEDDYDDEDDEDEDEEAEKPSASGHRKTTS